MVITLLFLLVLAAGIAVNLSRRLHVERERLRVERERPCAMCALHVAARMALRADLAQERRVSAAWRAAARRATAWDVVVVGCPVEVGNADPEAVTVETGAIR